MKLQLDIISITRANILEYIKDLTIEQVNYIPNHLNNSIGWQVTHLVVTQQLLHYKLSDNPILINDDLVENFRKGSAGKQSLSTDQWKEVLVLLERLPIRLAKDYNKGFFTTYTTYETSYNITLNCIEDAIAFSNVHDALHFGIIMAMTKCLPE